MNYRDRELVQGRNALLCIGGAAWVALLLCTGASAHCPTMLSGSMPLRESLHMLKSMNSPASLVTGWFLMLAAMMAPVLILPIHHVRVQSFRRRRLRSIALFIIGYMGIWLIGGVVLLGMALVAELFVGPFYLSVAGVLTALVWQFSPIKQHCLNRGHVHPPLPAFGLAADYAAFGFGVRHGIWCVGSCWALMAFPMLLPQGNIAAMAAVSFLIFSERLDEPAWPRWSCRLSNKLMRVIIAQTRIRLNGLSTRHL